MMMKSVLYIVLVLSIFLVVEAQAASQNSVGDEDQWIAAAQQGNHSTYRMQDCPIVGNLETGLYHTPAQPNYKQMLVKNKCAESGECQDNRRCFDSEEQALAAEVVACPQINGRVDRCSESQKISRHFIKSQSRNFNQK